jgi:protein phosphatase
MTIDKQPEDLGKGAAGDARIKAALRNPDAAATEAHPQSRIFSLMEEVEKRLPGPFLGEINKKHVVFVGDTHGDALVTKAIFDRYYDRTDLMVFLGDYVDKSNHSVDNLLVLLSKVLEDPDKIAFIRGNHESRHLNEKYNFMKEVELKFGREKYAAFESFFSKMPYAVVVNGYFCVHAGIAERLRSLDQIAKKNFPESESERRIAYELMWNDPNGSVEWFEHNYKRSRSEDGPLFYGRAAVDRFLEENSLQGIIRSHETPCGGHSTSMNGKVRTVGQFGDIMGVLRMERGVMKQEHIYTHILRLASH